MTPSQLASEVNETVRLAQLRIIGVGADDYYDPETSRQRFEDMEIDDLLAYAEEEALDLINYSVMMIIRFRRTRAELKRVTGGIIGETNT